MLDRVFSRREEENIEELLNNMDVTEENIYEGADALVKPMNLASEQEAMLAVNELRAGNLVLLNISDMQKRNKAQLKQLLDMIKVEVSKIDGDLAGISADRVLATPSKIKIVKRRE